LSANQTFPARRCGGLQFIRRLCVGSTLVGIVALKAASAETANIAVVKFGGGAPQIAKQVEHNMFCCARHASGGIDGDSLHESGKDLGALRNTQTIHFLSCKHI
jgi:hypothetical protein